MPADITVIGVNDGMGGLKESLAKFRKHHVEVGDALMNVSGVGTATGAMVDKDEPRPLYEHQDYPRMLYHADGREKTVNGIEDQREAEKIGFRTKPYLRPAVHLADPQTEKRELLDRNRELTARLAELAERLEAVEKRPTKQG